MTWKKFRCQRRCARAGIQVCKARSCAVCGDQPVCFGPETACRTDARQPQG